MRHLENEGLIRTSPLRSDDRVVVLTERGWNLLEANRYERPERSYEPRLTFYAGPAECQQRFRDLLGHASILTTDNQRLEALQAAVERLEGGKTFDPKTEAAEAFKNLSRSHRTELR